MIFLKNKESKRIDLVDANDFCDSFSVQGDMRQQWGDYFHPFEHENSVMNRNRRSVSRYLQAVLRYVILYIGSQYELNVPFSETRGRTVKHAKWTAIDLLERHCVFSRSVRSSDRLSLVRTRTTKSYNRRHRRYRRMYTSLLDVETVLHFIPLRPKNRSNGT